MSASHLKAGSASAHKAQVISYLRNQMAQITASSADGSIFASNTDEASACQDVDSASSFLQREEESAFTRSGLQEMSAAIASIQDTKPAVSSSLNSLSQGAREAFCRLECLCSYGEYSQVKMRARLLREEFESHDVEDAIEHAVRCNIINDLRYGEGLAHSRYRSGKGKIIIERDLRNHNIEPSDIDGWPFEFEERYGSEYQRALKQVAGNMPRSKNPAASAYRRLVNKGYDGATAKRVISELF